ncbi:hypothetical protein PoB_005364900 [Plakobranchus ocellatus]|uniref:Uncharacterized protein n=1 Tax=Plakobranchus ocellatus TaxID=259542 RepID=A0AAV4C7U8_9GAST|nr:hypothetical protein PoB_005364900 [Plakobranchus ocellatus]
MGCSDSHRYFVEKVTGAPLARQQTCCQPSSDARPGFDQSRCALRCDHHWGLLPVGKPTPLFLPSSPPNGSMAQLRCFLAPSLLVITRFIGIEH